MAAFVNEASINKKINEYLGKSAEGKRRVRNLVKDAVSENGGFSDPNFRTGYQIGEDFIRVLKTHINDAAGLDYAGGELGSTAVSALQKNLWCSIEDISEGDSSVSGIIHYTYRVKIHWGIDTRRPSLNPQKYPNGIYDIVVLLDKGYSAKSSVTGVWNGHTDKPIRSLKHRDGAHFVEDAIRDYKETYGYIDGVYIIRAQDLDIWEEMW